MADTWKPDGGVTRTFDTVIDGRFVPLPTPAVEVTARLIPGSNITYVDVGGRKASTLQIEIRCATVPGYGAMAISLGQSGLLTYQGVQYAATLTDIGNVRQEFSGDFPAVHCTATWLIDP